MLKKNMIVLSVVISTHLFANSATVVGVGGKQFLN